MTDKEKIIKLQGQLTKVTNESRALRDKNQIVHCEDCDTYHKDFEGMREPDYEGYCPNCHGETNWAVVNILDRRDEIISFFNGEV